MGNLEVAADIARQPVLHPALAVTRDLVLLQERLGHSFADPALLERALTHASALKVKRRREGNSTYQRLEFLGDRVLGLAIADLIMRRYPLDDEGDLSRRFHKLVSGETCALVAGDIGLDPFIRTGESLARIGKRAATSIRADVCEGVIGAIYRDGGLDAARQMIERYWTPRMEAMEGPLRDPKTELQEWAHKSGFGTPDYAEIDRIGPDHAPEFRVEVRLDGIVGAEGAGRSKREAEQRAAKAVLRREGVWQAK